MIDAAPAPEAGRPHFAVVGIGASAGCISALLRLFEHAPPEAGVAYVVVVHLSPRHESNIDAILTRATSMPVVQVMSTTKLQPNHVYVISPAHELTMRDGHLDVAALERPVGRHVAIDTFFRTLADVHRERAIAIVLSGSGVDGSLGLRRVKEQGGLTFAQSPEDAEYSAMPNSAIATGAVDFVLPAEQIGPKLAALWVNMQRIALPDTPGDELDTPLLPPDEVQQSETALAEVITMLRARTGHDFRRYKRATVMRRIERRLQVNGIPTLPAYRDFLESHLEETPALLQDLLISVTNFFRDREAFEALEHQLDATLFKPGPERAKIRAWIAGCATGEEAYSVAMLLAERAARQQREPELQLFASDIDERAITIARAGMYPDTVVNDVSPNRLRQFFNKEQGQVRVRKDLRDTILFAAHNILRDPPFSNLDLVCCRNVLIYLDREVQSQVLEVMHFALRPGGLLFLGSSETVEAAGDLFIEVDKKHRIYRANGTLRGSRALGALALGDRARLLAPAPPPAVHTALGDLHTRLRESGAPASVLVDDNFNILHATARAASFLRFSPGPSRNLLDVARPELRLELRTALFHAHGTREAVEARRVRLGNGEHGSWITMTARPLEESGMRYVLVSFDQVDATLDAGEHPGNDPMLGLLEEELQHTREELRGSVGRSATSTEELRASNEELQAINEELRSATEELETSKEELQSVNEELVTVNQELKSNIDEATRANDDLVNLIASTDIATVFVDRQMRIKRFTPRASELFSLIASDVGRSLLDITHRLDYDQLEEDAVQAFDALRVVEREVTCDEKRTYLVRVLPYRTHDNVIAGAVFNFVEISAIRRAEERLRVGEENLRRVVESTQDYAIVTLGVDGSIATWNPGATRMFGYAEAEMIGRPIATIFTPEDQATDDVQAILAQARDDGRAIDDRWKVRKDGSTFFCSAIVTPMVDGTKLVGYAKIARDLTESKRAEAQLEALFDQEKEMRAELQRAIALKDEFLAVMSHELKLPLNLIHVNAELLARLPEVREAPAVSRAADVIRRTVLSQSKIIDDLLDLSRMRTGKLALSRAPVQWAVVIERVIGAIADDARALRLTVRSSLDPAASPIHADRVRIEQIVWNLLSNALKFTPPGGSVEVRLSLDGDFSRLDVIDSGQGIEPEFLDHVFEMFRQANRSTTRAQGGMGIGLALVKELAEEHGGRVAAWSDGPGLGARFSVWLPRGAAPSPRSAGTASLPALSGLHVLLVDDAEDALESFAALLRLEGADVEAVAGGEEALAAVERETFDLILSDVAMPGMDGYELIAALRRRPATADVPALALTGFGRPQDAQRALVAGFDGHLAKPIVIDELIQILKRLPKLATRHRTALVTGPGEAPLNPQ